MECLETEIPPVATELKKGNFVVNKTNPAFFSLPIDQAHEQNNKIVKGDRGAIGLTDSSTQLLRWMVSGPEISRIITDFELSQEIVRNTTKQEQQEDLRHHKQIKGVQNTFCKQVNAVCSTTEEMRKPFADQTGEMFVLDTRDIADSKVVETIRTVEQLGKDQYQRFVTKRLQERTTPLFDTIQKNKLPLFSSPPATRENSSDRLKIASLKSNCSLFSCLYLSCQVRNGDLEGFSGLENQSFPPSLSQYGKLRSDTKSDLLSCLEKNGPAQAQKPSLEALLLGGAANVNMLTPGASNTYFKSTARLSSFHT